MDYTNKYFKYKTKYFTLKEQLNEKSTNLNDCDTNKICYYDSNLKTNIYHFNSKIENKIADQEAKLKAEQTEKQCGTLSRMDPKIQICNTNPSFRTHIYHFDADLNNRLIVNYQSVDKTEEYIYNFITFDNFKDICDLENILDKCIKENILIYINSEDNCDFIIRFNNYIQNILDKSSIRRFLNVTIINKTTNLKCMVYELENNNEDIYKKIINIIPDNAQVLFNLNDYNKLFQKGYIPNRKKTVVYELNKESNNSTIRLNQKGGTIIREITFMVNTNINNEKELENSWWFKYYFQIPNCAYGRLTQSTGTCWCNSLINSLILNPSIVNLLIDKFNKLGEKNKNIIKNIDSFDKFNSSKEKLFTLLYAVINLLLIRKIKAKQKNGNFIAELATRIKGIYENEGKGDLKFTSGEIIKPEDHEFFYTLQGGVKYGDAGDSNKGLNVVLNKLFSENEYIIIDYKYTKSNELFIKANELIDKENELSQEEVTLANKKLNELSREEVTLANKKLNELSQKKVTLANQKLNELSREEVTLANKKLNELSQEKVTLANQKLKGLSVKQNEIDEIMNSNYKNFPDLNQIINNINEIMNSNYKNFPDLNQIINNINEIMNSNYENFPDLNQIINNINEIKNSNYKNFSDLNQIINNMNEIKNSNYKNFPDLNQIKSYRAKINEEIAKIEDERAKITNDPSKNDVGKFFYKLKENIINFKQIDKNIQIEINSIVLPNIIIISYEVINNILNKNLLNVQSNAPDKIILNNTSYIISSAGLSLSGPSAGHAIAGLKCNNSLYVYDSNNYLAYTNWNKYDEKDKTNDQYRELLNSQDTSGQGKHYGNYPSDTKSLPPYKLLYVIYTKE